MTTKAVVFGAGMVGSVIAEDLSESGFSSHHRRSMYSDSALSESG